MFNEQDRDQLLVDILEALAHVTSQLEFQRFSSRVLHDKVAYYRERLHEYVSEDELKNPSIKRNV